MLLAGVTLDVNARQSEKRTTQRKAEPMPGQGERRQMHRVMQRIFADRPLAEQSHGWQLG